MPNRDTDPPDFLDECDDAVFEDLWAYAPQGWNPYYVLNFRAENTMPVVPTAGMLDDLHDKLTRLQPRREVRP